MLQDLRDQKNSALIVILFAVIIIVFIFMFGLPSKDSLSSKGQTDVAVFNGEHLSRKVPHELMRTMILNQYDDSIFNNVQYPQIARQTAEGIGVIYLLADEARKAGLRVSDEDLHDYITNWESGNADILRYGFLQKNVFSQRNYNDALRRMQLSSRDYESYKREELLARRYLTLLASSITISDASLWDAYQEANATASLEVIRITPENVLKTFKPLTDEEIRAFATTGKADIQAFYDANIARYTTPEKVKMQQIVITKQFGTIQNPGAKTGKTLQSGERFQIAKKEALKPNVDFAQAYADYDESDDKSLQGMTGLIAVEVMAQEIQTALEGKKVGDVFTAELGDRYVIGKIVERHETVVKPLDEVTNEIARQLLEERRIAAKTSEITTNILAQAATTPLADLIDKTMYAGILAEAPKAPVAPVATDDDNDADTDAAADSDANADTADTDAANDAADTDAANDAAAGTDAAADTNTAIAQAEPQYVDLPTDLIIIPEIERTKVASFNDVTANTNYIQGIGVNDDLARDIRAAAPNTVLAQSYTIGKDTVIVKVVSKKEADRAAFEANIDALRSGAIQARVVALIGDTDAIINLKGGYGIWLEQKINDAMQKGTLRIESDYFTKLSTRIQKKQEEQNNPQ